MLNPFDAFALAQEWLFERLIEPAAFSLGLGNLLEDGFVATGWLLVGLLQIAVLLLLIGPRSGAGRSSRWWTAPPSAWT
jgi:hypothetical protein